jgi:serine-type D-Ala-D-Ala carboxypeptidase/endopeptidase (penicillin-binding protein 4)
MLRKIFLLITLATIFSACSTPPVANEPPQAEQQTQLNNSGPSASGQADVVDGELAREIDHLIDNGELASARWGVSVVSLKDKRVFYQRNADKLFTPASNMKLFPTAVALELLGADYRWQTSVYAITSPDAGGTVNGDLVLYGRGAPDLTVARNHEESANSLDQLAKALYDKGVRHVRGNVIGDDSYFRGNPLGDGWQWNDVQWYYGAEASALSINNNETSISILPPENRETSPVIRVADPTGYVTVDNRMATSAPGERITLGIKRGLSDNSVHIWGTFPSGSKGFGARLAVHRPALWAAKFFVETLKARGIAVDGNALTRDAHEPIAARFDPQQARELASVFSKPLREIIKATNKGSINLYAELILRTLGRERAALLPALEPSARELGDDEIGLAIIKLWLNRSQVATPGLALHDGSGLSRLNLISPQAFVQLLMAMARSPNNQVFRDSLPLSGRDGTLGYRLKDYAERVSAKTGYLTYDTALSGFVTTAEDEVLAFSIICNDDTGRASSGRQIDKIVTLLAAYPARTPEKAPK